MNFVYTIVVYANAEFCRIDDHAALHDPRSARLGGERSVARLRSTVRRPYRAS